MRRRLPIHIVSLAIGAFSPAANAQAFPSPEDAFRAYERARIQKDIPGFLATINFQQEAREALQRAGKEPTEASVAEMAANRQSELRSHLETRGFTRYGDCEVARTFQDSDKQVRFILFCKDGTGSMFFPVRVMQFPNGWLVVRGG
jgi:hypothetical protein